ncbi:MAG: response regulator [Acidobacteriota bacterium]|nr:response regulator [Acidobacteriota bacterium]
MKQETQRTIFLVEEDDETRRLLKHNLQTYGYRVLAALSEEDALERVSGVHPPPDLILVNFVGKSPEEALDAGRRIREHARYDGRTPLIVMPEKFPREFEGMDENVGGNDWVCYFEDAEQLQRLVGRVVDRDAP